MGCPPLLQHYLGTYAAPKYDSEGLEYLRRKDEGSSRHRRSTEVHAETADDGVVMVLKPWMYSVLAVGFAGIHALGCWKESMLVLVVGAIGAIACIWMMFGARDYWSES